MSKTDERIRLNRLHHRAAQLSIAKVAMRDAGEAINRLTREDGGSKTCPSFFREYLVEIDAIRMGLEATLRDVNILISQLSDTGEEQEEEER